MKRSAVLLLLLVAVLAGAATASVRVMAFNVQVYGVTKAGKPEVMDALVKSMADFDLIFMQEIRSTDEAPVNQLMTELNEFVEGEGRQFEISLSPRLGRTNSKEQYAYIYDPDKVELVDAYVWHDHPEDVFEREPYIARFRFAGSTSWLPSPGVVLASPYFSFIGIHVAPGDAVNELDALHDVYLNVSESLPGEAVALFGDFNADCSYVPQYAWANISLRTDPSLEWLIPDSADTTVSFSTNCAYDRLVANSAFDKMRSDFIAPSIYNFTAVLDISQELSLDVSDHYPIQFSLTISTTNVDETPSPTDGIDGTSTPTVPGGNGGNGPSLITPTPTSAAASISSGILALIFPLFYYIAQ